MSVVTEVINAVYKDDLDKVLVAVGLSSAIDSGQLKCVVCGEPVTRENLGAFVPDGDTVGVCCSNVRCLSKIVERYG
ncbi:MAG: hypothetical protein HPY58_12775 [Firmicutes bacterium]|nr:hypothetical protein [Bacillota bacterium]